MDAPTETNEPVKRKRKPAGFDDNDKQTEKAPTLNDDEVEDTKMGLELTGFNSDLVEWLMSDNQDIVPQLRGPGSGEVIWCKAK